MGHDSSQFGSVGSGLRASNAYRTGKVNLATVRQNTMGATVACVEISLGSVDRARVRPTTRLRLTCGSDFCLAMSSLAQLQLVGPPVLPPRPRLVRVRTCASAISFASSGSPLAICCQLGLRDWRPLPARSRICVP